MIIRKQEDKEKDNVEEFGKKEWKKPDKKHYGESVPDFSKLAECFVAKDDDVILGYIKIIVQAGVGSIDSLIVGEAYRGKDVGSSLIVFAEKRMKELGVHKVWLETGEDWDAKKLYEKNGYSVRTKLPKHYGGCDFLLMDKLLDVVKN